MKKVIPNLWVMQQIKVVKMVTIASCHNTADLTLRVVASLLCHLTLLKLAANAS